MHTRVHVYDPYRSVHALHYIDTVHVQFNALHHTERTTRMCIRKHVCRSHAVKNMIHWG